MLAVQGRDSAIELVVEIVRRHLPGWFYQINKGFGSIKISNYILNTKYSASQMGIF